MVGELLIQQKGRSNMLLHFVACVAMLFAGRSGRRF
jgi:hypothetical protein